MIACACADVPGIARSTVMFGVFMPVVLLLLAGAALTAVFALAWAADRMLRPRPQGTAHGNGTGHGDTVGPLSNTGPGSVGLDAFTWTEEEPRERR
ncbi:hypothetical protein AB0I00_04605 [Streptomyces sp. NPDC050803]|uniref:hypothetical protein n=1 Tax=unclassified Streptomyces TaxID=2593676 RepID=UPI00343F721C